MFSRMKFETNSVVVSGNVIPRVSKQVWLILESLTCFDILGIKGLRFEIDGKRCFRGRKSK